MCGRYKIVTDAQALYDAFQVEAELGAAALERYNVAPATDQLVILNEDGRRVARWHHWGLIPRWAKDKSIGYKTINARADSVAVRPAYRAAFRQRRCLVPATGFYEWKALERGKQPYLIRLKSGALFAFAGLWESWSGPEGGAKILYHHHHRTERTDGAHPRAHAGDRRARELCALARSGAARSGSGAGDDRELPWRRNAGGAGERRHQQRAQSGRRADRAGGRAARLTPETA
jgi:hypothetical protein